MNHPLPHALLSLAVEGETDAQETGEWLEALDAVVATVGRERAAYLLQQLQTRARKHGLRADAQRGTPYTNTIAPHQQAPFPGDLALEERLTALMRWNALAMVVRANQAYGELGGHIASYASAADLFEVGFNHFFRARSDTPGSSHGGDLVFYQPHSAPGVYARAFL
jgi:pyruvate dehydrogenase E1 component